MVAAPSPVSGSPHSMRTRCLVLAAVALLVLLVTHPIFVLPQLDADDYRHIDVVRQLRAGHIDLVTASIVENRWDHLWWIDCEQVVRFFRPTMVLSYLADDLLHGSSTRGLLLTNALLYLATCLVAAGLFLRILRQSAAAALASLLFAGFAAHSETIWYVAGRADTLAALSFLATLLLHTCSGRARSLALPCYLFALATKELTLSLPLVALWLDRYVRHTGPSWLACLRADRAMYVGYAALAATYLVARHLVLGAAGGSDLVFPYFVAPTRPDFPLHVWNQIRTYGENLFLAGITPPFLRADQVAERTTLVGTLLTLGLPLGAGWFLRRDPRFYWLALLALCTWLPTSLVYVSERFAFLPSFALAGVAGLGITHAGRAAALVVAIWCGHQTWALYAKNLAISQTPHEAAAIDGHLRELVGKLPPGKPIYVLNLPTDVLGAQFLPNMVRVVLDDPRRECHVLTLWPEAFVDMQTSSFERRGSDVLVVRGAPVLMKQSRWLFPWVSLATGTRVDRPRLGCKVEVADGDATECRALTFHLPRPLDDCVFVRCTLPPTSTQMPRGLLIAGGKFEVLRP